MAQHGHQFMMRRVLQHPQQIIDTSTSYLTRERTRTSGTLQEALTPQTSLVSTALQSLQYTVSKALHSIPTNFQACKTTTVQMKV
jgi:hypothetical protein